MNANIITFSRILLIFAVILLGSCRDCVLMKMSAPRGKYLDTKQSRILLRKRKSF